MRKISILLACLLLAACASTGKSNEVAVPVLIEGSGKNSEEAIKNGLVRAVEYQSGSVILSERESQHNKLITNDVGSYSAGYVEKYTVKQTKVENGRTIVSMEVWVRSSKLVDQKLNRGKDGSYIEGTDLGTQYSTYLADRQNTSNFLNKILNDFPSRALIVNQGKIEFKVDGQRNSYIEVPITISWNYDYLVALNEAFGKVHEGPSSFDVSCMCDRTSEIVTIISRKPGTFFGDRQSYYFKDIVLGRQIRNSFGRNTHLWIRTTIYGDNQEKLLNECYPANQAFSGSLTPSSYIVYGNEVVESVIEIKITPRNALYNQLNKATRIETAIVSKSLC